MKLAPARNLSVPGRSHKSALANLLVAACIAAPLVGCGSKKDTPGESDGTANLVLKAENNYSSTTTLKLDSINTVAGQDMKIIWSDVTKDLLCHDVNPGSDIKNISLIRLAKTTHDEAQKKLLSGELDSNSVAYRQHRTSSGETETQLAGMTLISGESKIIVGDDYKASAEDSYVLIASNTKEPGEGARSMVFLNPSEGSSVAEAKIPSGCGQLSFPINLHDLTKLSVSTEGPWVVSWKGITKDGEGKAIDWLGFDDGYDLIVGYYDISVTDLENDSFNLDSRAKKIWKIKGISEGTQKDLELAEDSSGKTFSGFDEAKDKLWALGLYCPTCQNPAPMFFTILELKD